MRQTGEHHGRRILECVENNGQKMFYDVIFSTRTMGTLRFGFFCSVNHCYGSGPGANAIFIVFG